MSETTQPADQPTPEAPPLPPSPGPLLKAAREKAGLKTQAIAKELHIHTSKLEALERDDYDRLPSDVFVQGYVRRYAKLVGLSEQELADTFIAYKNALRASHGEFVEEADAQPAASAPLPNWLLPTGVLGGAAVLIMVAVWFTMAPQESARQPSVSEARAAQSSAPVSPGQEHSATAREPSAPAREPSATTQEPSATVQETSASREEPSAEPSAISGSASESVDTQALPATSSQPLTQTEESSSTEEPANDTATADAAVLSNAEPLETAEPVATATYSEGELTLSLTDDCWVKVTDAAGEVVFARLVGAGESVDVTGLVPMEVMLGNARAAELSFNGTLVPVNILPGRDTAKVVVGG